MRRQIRRLDRRISQLDQISHRFSAVRLTIVIAGILAIGLLNFFVSESAAWITGLVVAITFMVVARFHDRIETSLKRHKIWRRIKSTHVARITLDWPVIPSPTVTTPEPTHPFDTDLNLTGELSLHQLLDISTSQGGSERLRDWLVDQSPEPERIHSRQALVRELIPLSIFRDKLTLQGYRTREDMDQRWNGETVCRWLDQNKSYMSLGPYVILLGLLSVTTIASFLLSSFDYMPAWWWISFSIYVFIYFGLYSSSRAAMDSLDADASHLESVLKPFRSILLYIESYPTTKSPHLEACFEPFHSAGKRPSLHLKQIGLIAGGAKWQHGQLLWLILNALVPWDLYFTYRLHLFRAQLKTHLPIWLETWYNLEAYISLANFGYLNPKTIFPEVADTIEADKPVFHAQQMGHPFLQEDHRTCNDFIKEQVHDIAIITGSNMSGKSTFLRTLGINLCLAYAGSPVVADAFYTIPFRLFTSMKITDSVTDGISYFYAEVKRLKVLLQAINEPHPYPLFFLIDEIFRGTNNRERLIGSRSYIKSLVAKNGVGIISTHDLDLVQLEEEISRIRNYHFREDVSDGTMVFDYQLRTGPCPTTNALKIMQIEGLPVEDEHG